MWCSDQAPHHSIYKMISTNNFKTYLTTYHGIRKLKRKRDNEAEFSDDKSVDIECTLQSLFSGSCNVYTILMKGVKNTKALLSKDLVSRFKYYLIL